MFIYAVMLTATIAVVTGVGEGFTGPAIWLEDIALMTCTGAGIVDAGVLTATIIDVTRSPALLSVSR